MRVLILIFLPVISIFLQSTIFNTYSIKGTVPDMVLIFVVFYALFNGSSKGTVYGLLCGLLEDLYIGRFIGLNAISKAIVAYAVSRFQVNVFRENIMVGVVTVVASTVLNGILMFLIALASFKIFNVNLSILNTMLYQTFYNMVLAVPLYAWYYHSNHNGLLRSGGDGV